MSDGRVVGSRISHLPDRPKKRLRFFDRLARILRDRLSREHSCEQFLVLVETRSERVARRVTTGKTLLQHIDREKADLHRLSGSNTRLAWTIGFRGNSPNHVAQEDFEASRDPYRERIRKRAAQPPRQTLLHHRRHRSTSSRALPHFHANIFAEMSFFHHTFSLLRKPLKHHQRTERASSSQESKNARMRGVRAWAR